MLVRVYSPALSVEDPTSAISPAKPGKALASCSANVERSSALLVQTIVQKLGISTSDYMLWFCETDNSVVDIDKLCQLIQGNKHNAMVEDKDVVILICVPQPKPLAFAQRRLTGSSGSVSLHHEPPAAAAQRQQLDRSDSRLEFSDPPEQFEFDDDNEKTASESEDAVVAEAAAKPRLKAKRASPLLSPDFRKQCGRLVACSWPADAQGLQPLTGPRAADRRIVGWVLQMAYKLAQKAVAIGDTVNPEGGALTKLVIADQI